METCISFVAGATAFPRISLFFKRLRIGTSRWLLPETLTAVLVVGVLSFAGNAGAADFEYSGDKGPAFWAEQDPAWEACAGTADDFLRQSPIDISGVKINPRLQKLYLTLLKTPINLLNNGHVIENEYEPGSTLQFGSVTYILAEFHFHTLSEHTVGGERGVMELHAVFKDDLVNTTKIAVVGMMYKIGRANSFLQELIDAGLPEKSMSPHVHGNQINLADALTDTAAYYTYQGSLTTPPCSENVTWIVIKRQAQMSEEQFQAFRKILGNDFRPLQDRNDRRIEATAKGGSGEAHGHDND
jgi:carbonic anhydrase